MSTPTDHPRVENLLLRRLVLRELEPGDEAALREAVREFAVSDPDWDFAFHFDRDTDFDDYLELLEREKTGDGPDGWVPHTFLVAIEDDRIIGRVSLRHELNEFLLGFGGHIGFGVVASARRRGYAAEMLRRTLVLAADLGIERALLTCDDNNIASIRTIESCGGELEDRRPRDEGGLTRRYWIDTGK